MVQVIAGRYELVELLGRGGMGAVWRARDRTLDREVAVKEVTLPQGLDDAQVERLYARTFREARSAARLDHPGIVTVHDVVEEDGRPWIVMRLVRAEALDKAIAREGSLPPGRVASIGLDLLDALGAAHAAGVVHRDVKPGNVLLPPGRAVLTDFGIATVAGDETLTQAGAIVGSPAYLAPEQARHQKATPASDLWSLGATLYAAVEGRPPYKRPDVWGVMAALLSDEPDPVERAGPLAPVLHGLLRKDPAQRMGPDEAGRLLREVAQREVAQREVGQGAPHHVPGRPGFAPPVPGPRDVTLQNPAVPGEHGPFGHVPDGPGPTAPGAPAAPTVVPPGPAAPKRPPWALIVPAAVFAAAIVAAVVTIAVFVDQEPEAGQDGRPVASGSASPGSGGSSGPAAGVPDGYRPYRGSAFVAAVPEGWKEDGSGDDVTFTDQTEGVKRALSIQRVSVLPSDPGDALADAAREMKDDSDFPQYEQESFRRGIPYLGGTAAELQFSFVREGVPGRARARVFRLDGVLYQVLLVGDQEHWDAGVPYYETVLKTLRSPS